MASSTLVFPWPRTQKTTVPYTLTSVDTSSTGTEDHFAIRSPVLIRESNSITFRGVLYRDDQRVINIVCKFAYGKRNLKRLRHEATIYRERLQDLGGIVVPKFYGLYEGEMEDEELTGCLVTQYCGKHAEVPFYGLPWETKVLLIGAMVRLHDAGVLHGDFREANVVFTPKGTPCIIDFDRAQAHTCESTMTIEVHRPQPDPEEFGCDELFSACNSAGIWTPCHIKYLHVYRPIEYVESAEKLASLAPKNVDRELALEIAERVIYEHWEGMRKRLACDWNSSAKRQCLRTALVQSYDT